MRTLLFAAAALVAAGVVGPRMGRRRSIDRRRRTGPKVVTARFEVRYDGNPEYGTWVPALGDDGLSAENMRLVDEVNGREHFVLRNADGECLCSGPFANMDSGESSVISAMFPAPPANATHASLETPGFASFDAVPLS